MKAVEYFYAITSPWAYLGMRRFIELAEQENVEIKPFVITILTENGAIPGKTRPPVRQEYGLTELRRWSAHLQLPMKIDGRGSLRDATPAAKMVIAADLFGKPWLPLSLALQTAFWERGENIGDPDTRGRIADAEGYEGQRLLAAESEGPVQDRWESNLSYATSLGVFGSPTYRYNGELYWGQDRLDFLQRALAA